MLIRQMKLNKIPSLTLPLVPTVQTDKPLYSVGTLFMENQNRKVSFYCIKNPKTLEVLYIGKTVGKLNSRLTKHVNKPMGKIGSRMGT